MGSVRRSATTLRISNATAKPLQQRLALLSSPNMGVDSSKVQAVCGVGMGGCMGGLGPDLPPQSLAVMLLVQALVVRDAVVAVDEAVAGG